MGQKKKEAKQKPLDKMTAKELRELALEMGGIAGVHAMNKDELLSSIKAAKGIVDDKKKSSSNVREIKVKIRELRIKREKALEADDKKMAQILLRRIGRLKKKTRRAA